MNDNYAGEFEVMLVDDDPGDRFMFRELLGDIDGNIKLIEARDGAHMSTLLEDIEEPPPPHIIFLDINMPLKNGHECLREIRNNKKFSEVPIVMYTTSGNQNDINESYDSGANLYILKGNSPDETVDALKNTFTGYHLNALKNIARDKYFVG